VDYEHDLLVINDVQLYLLNDQILDEKTTNDLINNKHKTWLYHEQTLQGEFDGLEVLSPIELTGAVMTGSYPKNGGAWTDKDSVYGDHVATLAIDGDLNTYAMSGQSQEIIDLNHGHDSGADFDAHIDITFAEAEISMIEIFNQHEWRQYLYVQKRWDNLYAQIFDGDKSVWRVQLADPGYTSPRNRDGKETFEIKTPVTGNRVRIGTWNSKAGRTGRDILMVAEAIVYGSTL